MTINKESDTMTDKAEEAEDRQIRPFADFLQDLANGVTVAELSHALLELTEAVTATGKKGRLTLTLSMDTVGNNTTTVNVTGKVDLKLPQSDPASSVFFPDADGNLRRDNPAQPRLPLREVTPPAGVDPDTGELKEVPAR